MTDRAGPPTFIAWLAAGSPPLRGAHRGGWCACCGSDQDPTVAATTVISRKFTDADAWRYDSDELCTACAWSYSTAELRRSVYLIGHTPPRRTLITRADLGSGLAHRPLPPGQTAVIAVRGRRHILPTAEWGHVCTDDTQLRWDDAAVKLLASLRWLRSLPTVRAHMLAAPSPPITVMRAHPDRWATIIEQWSALEVWRTHPGSWWDAAIALSTPPGASTPAE